MTQRVYRGQGTICHPGETQGISQGQGRPHHLRPSLHHLFDVTLSKVIAQWNPPAGPSQRQPCLRLRLLPLFLATLCSIAHAFPGEQWRNGVGEGPLGHAGILSSRHGVWHFNTSQFTLLVAWWITSNLIPRGPREHSRF